MSSATVASPRGRRKLSQSGHGPMNELNITPLMDLVMVLLVIFMITTPQLSNDLELNLPSGKAPATRPKEKPKVNYVDVDPKGGLKLNGQDVVLADLPRLFQEVKKSEADPSVVVRGSDEVNYQHVISVIDLLQQADINKVGLATAAPR